MTGAAKVSRHFEEGTAVFHKRHGHGVIKRGFTGNLYPYFEATKTTGTVTTRVWATDELSA